MARKETLLPQSLRQPQVPKRSFVSDQFSVTWDQVAAFRLARHHLSRQARKKTVLSVVGDMGGAQAQLLSAAQIALWARVRDLQIEDIEQVMRARTLVKASCMRRTLFLVPSEHLAVFVRGTAGRAEKEIRWALGKGVPQRTIDAAIEAALGVLDEPLTRPEIAERASRALGVRMGTFEGGGWGNRRKLAAVPVGHLHYPVVELLHLAGARGVVCYGPNRGSEPTFVRADAWIPGWQDVPREQAERLLLRIYLRSFGPATATDFGLWSGITLTEARRIWGREQENLVTVNVEGWEAAILQEDVGALTRAEIERPLVRLLPYFDSYLLGHKEREHLAAREHRPRIYRPQGWIAPVVLVDGRGVAVWEYARKGNRLAVQVRAFGSVPPNISARIRAEAEDLARFLGAANVEVQLAK